jgi:hypothetical protein
MGEVTLGSAASEFERSALPSISKDNQKTRNYLNQLKNYFTEWHM